METSLFNSWLDHFLQHAVPARPLLLLLDDHSTHYSPHIITKVMEKDAIILCLPPHSSQDTQPLDVGVYVYAGILLFICIFLAMLIIKCFSCGWG